MRKYGAKTYVESEQYHLDKLAVFIQKHDKYGEILSRNKCTLHCKCHLCNQEYNINYQAFAARADSNVITCTFCNKIAVHSIEEKSLTSFIKSIYIGEVIENCRKVINGREIDIYIPEKKLAIEFDGLYWHNEVNKEPTYHLQKTELAERADIQMIHVFEDEWLYQQEVVKSRIKQLLGLNRRIYARKCKCSVISHDVSKQFLDKYHLQHSCNSKYDYGLYYNDELVAVMTFGSTRFSHNNACELLRFATKTDISIIGGASKLFKHFLKEHPEITNIVSYADRRWSIGNLYKQLGFTFTSKTKPSYYYIVDYKRQNRMNFQKHKLVAEGFDPNKTEHEIMLERKIYRIYDCGSLKFEFNMQHKNSSKQKFTA